ncbi:MAG: glucose 1-dehydrogenase [Deltaproteobacteria bacterium]|nr:glucose 1-dehydrogenase [Deltaproteobacteria bacterium]MBW1960737.1 glucose 1-dehydrogenase [Deltaproteobacteria bacterium]MBW1993641.1 glucose 1-dehydrogenase [Deltaproteobacteria bacterium]MBW2152609.1 glucose 1-dehydrogenase [Deltaproteobacteria bacterium]
MEHSHAEFDLTGKVAIVTGAGRGIGYHISLALARYGADLMLCSRNVRELEAVAEKVQRLNRKVVARQMDIRKIFEIQQMVKDVVGNFGRIDILVNNAGINIPQWAVDVTEDAWDDIMATNLKGLFFCSQAVGKVMIQQRKGKIINVSSQAGSVGLIRRAAYCSSKGGVNQLTRVLAIEWAKYNINVNAIAPTFIETPFTEPMFKEKRFKEYVLDNIPLGRIGKPKDVIGAVIFLASEASDLVTGHTLLIDGGWTAQ